MFLLYCLVNYGDKQLQIVIIWVIQFALKHFALTLQTKQQELLQYNYIFTTDIHKVCKLSRVESPKVIGLGIGI